ncbi:MAG: Hint domain-containing protein [Maritimibacter sp.]
MLHFRSPAVERDLDPGLLRDLEGGSGQNPLSVFSTSGLAPSALVETVNGPVLARDLKPGDRVLTRDNGVQSVRWAGESMSMFDPDAEQASAKGPVRIRAGALGTNKEAGNLVLAPGQQVLVRGIMNELLFGTDEVMASVGDLAHLDGVDFVPRSVVRWQHVLLDTHELLNVNGVWMESFSPEMWSIRVAFPEQWEEITTAVPRLRYENGSAAYISPRLSLNGREAILLNEI